MKNKSYLLLLAFTLLLSCNKKSVFDELPCNYNGFKYYDNEPYPLGEMSENYILIGIDSSNSDKSIQDFINSKDYLDNSYNFEIHKDNNYPYKYFGLKLNRTCSCEEISWIINDLEENSMTSFVHYTMQTDDCTNLIWETIGELCVNSYSNIFYVKVLDTNNLTDLNNTLIETNTRIREQNQFMNQWYSVFADKNSKGDALDMANYFYETGLFAASEPDIIKIVVE